MKFRAANVSPTYPVILVRFCFCILHPEILILPATPEPVYFIIIIRICIRLKSENKNKKSKSFHLKIALQTHYIKMLTKRIQYYVKKIIEHDYVGFIPGMQGWVNIRKFMSKSHMIIHLKRKLKGFHLQMKKMSVMKIQYLFLMKILKKIGNNAFLIYSRIKPASYFRGTGEKFFKIGTRQGGLLLPQRPTIVLKALPMLANWEKLTYRNQRPGARRARGGQWG